MCLIHNSGSIQNSGGAVRSDCTIRVARRMGMAALALIACGCGSTKVVKIPERIAASPPADRATDLRGWQPVVATYQNGGTQAWPTRQYYQPNPDSEERVNYLLDPLMFLAQSASLPVTMAMEPPFEKTIYDGEVPPPSYAAMPPRFLGTPVNPDPDPLAAPKPRSGPPLPPRPVLPPPQVILPDQSGAPPKTAPMPPETAPVQPQTLPAPQSAPASEPTSAPSGRPSPASAPATHPATAPDISTSGGDL